MARSTLGGFFAVALILAVPAGAVRAQPPVPGGIHSRPPAFSPYLNLLRGGGSPALNYYGLVRPEMQFRQSIQGLAGAVAANQNAIGELGSEIGMMGSTGHPTQFMNLGGYFMNNNVGAPGGAPRYGSGSLNLSRPGGATGGSGAPAGRR